VGNMASDVRARHAWFWRGGRAWPRALLSFLWFLPYLPHAAISSPSFCLAGAASDLVRYLFGMPRLPCRLLFLLAQRVNIASSVLSSHPFLYVPRARSFFFFCGSVSSAARQPGGPCMDAVRIA